MENEKKRMFPLGKLMQLRVKCQHYNNIMGDIYIDTTGESSQPWLMMNLAMKFLLYQKYNTRSKAKQKRTSRLNVQKRFQSFR
jgi:hypothetical protein